MIREEGITEQLQYLGYGHMPSNLHLALAAYPHAEDTHSVSQHGEIENPSFSPNSTSLHWPRYHLSTPPSQVPYITTSRAEEQLASVATSTHTQTPPFDIPDPWGVGGLPETASTVMPEMIYQEMDFMEELDASERPTFHTPFASPMPQHSGITHRPELLDFRFANSRVDTSAPDNDMGIAPTAEESASIATPPMPTKNSSTPKRLGRRGKVQCDPCRLAKRNYECKPVDPADPSSKCTKCRDRGILGKCTGLRLPPGQRERVLNQQLQVANQTELTRLSATLDVLVPKVEKLTRFMKMICNTVFRPREMRFPYHLTTDDMPEGLNPNLMETSQSTDPATAPVSLAEIASVVHADGVTTQQNAAIIAESLEIYFRSVQVPITHLRASSPIVFLTDETPCPLVEWREGNFHVMTLFKVSEAENQCTWLMHTFQLNTPFNFPSWISWRTTNLYILEDLFRAAQHLFRLFDWPQEALMRLCYQNTCDDLERFEELVGLLFDHEEDMRKFGYSVNKLIPVFEAASSKTNVSGEDGTRYTVYEASTKPTEPTLRARI